MHRNSALSLAALLVAGTSAWAQEVTLRGAHSGLWFSPGQTGHGLQVAILGPRRAVVTWNAYTPDGEPLWLFGTGTIDGATVTAELSRYRGGSFPPNFDPAMVTGEAWGTILLTYESCSAANLSWTVELEGFEGGELPLERLTATDGLGCGAAETFHRTTTFSFDAGPGRWEPLFADYGVAQEDTIDTRGEWTTLPPPLEHRAGYVLGGTNTPDSLAMFLKAPLGGLAPDTVYALELAMTFATSVPQDCVGIGGSPGTAVFVKLGASTNEPMAVREGDDFRLDIDKGNQSRGGEDAVVVGDMTNFQENCTDDTEWQLKTVSTAGEDFRARTDEGGRLWIYGGTDSGFEGRTVYFIADYTARLIRME